MIWIPQVLAILLQIGQYPGKCEPWSVCDLWTGGDWKHVGRVATSLNPTFWIRPHTRMIRRIGRPEIEFVWKIALHFPAEFTHTGFTVEERSAALDEIEVDAVRMQITAPRVDGCLCVKIERNALQGTSFMKRCLQISSQLKETNNQIRIKIRPLLASSEEATAYNIHWTSFPEFPNYVILVYNSTHMRHLVQEKSPLLLSNLRKGTTYFVCIRANAPSSQSKCKSWTTMMLPPPLVDENASQLFKLWPRMEGEGKTWVQLSWAPPSIRGPHLLPPPEGYLVIVSRPYHQIPDHVYQLLIPWGSKIQLDELQKQVTGVLSSLQSASRPIPANLDVPWPDYKSSRRNFWIDGWNTGSMDDMGPHNLFVFTVSGLRENQAYNFTIVPLFLPSPANINLMRFASTLTATTFVGGPSYDISLNSLITLMGDTHFVNLQMLGVGGSTCFRSSNCIQIQRNDSDLVIPSVVYGIQCYWGPAMNVKKCFEDLQPNATYRVRLQEGKYGVPILQGIVHTTTEKVFGKITYVDAITLARNLLSVKFPLPKLPDMPSSPLAYVIYLCPSSAKDCKSSANFTYAIGTYELRWSLSFCRIEKSLDAECFMRLPSELGGRKGLERLNLQIVPFFGSLDEKDVETANTSFYLLNSPCDQTCTWPADDFNNAGHISNTAIELPVYSQDHLGTITSSGEPLPSSSLCYPLPGSFDGDFHVHSTGHSYLCPLPKCHSVYNIGCLTNVEVQHYSTDAFTLQWDPPRISKEDVRGYVTTAITPSNCKDSKFLSSVILFKYDGTMYRSIDLQDILTAKQCGQNISRSFPADGKLMNADFRGLWQNTPYIVNIIPVGKLGDLGATWTLKLQTKEAVPCKPLHVELVLKDSHITLKWKEQTGPACGKTKRLLIDFQTDSNKPLRKEMSLADDSDDPNDGNYNEVQLVPSEYCHRYAAGLILQNNAGSSFYANASSALSIGYPAWTDQPVIEPSVDQKHLEVAYSFASSCKYNSDLEVKVLKGSSSMSRRGIHVNSTWTKIELPRLTNGLVYTARVQIRGVAGHKSAPPEHSPWSDWIEIPTTAALTKVDLANVSVFPLEISNDGGRMLSCPVSQHDSSPSFFQAVDVRASPKLSMCLEVGWDFLTPRTGVFGFLLVLKSSEASSEAEDAKENSTLSTNIHCRTIWIPCSDCVGEYTWKNSKDVVLEDMLKVFENCASKSGPKTAAISMMEELQQYMELSSTLDGTLNAVHKRVVLQLFLAEEDKPPSKSGSVQLYALKALQMQLAMQQAWGKTEKAYVTTASMTTAITVGAIFIILAIILAACFVVRNLRRRRMKKLPYAYLGDTEGDDESETRTSPIMPARIFSPVNRIPSPIRLIDFENEVKRYAERQFEFLSREFKNLQRHAKNRESEMQWTTNAATQPCNTPRNKYKNVIPYDFNRVKLHSACTLDALHGECTSDVDSKLLQSQSDYVNASLIPGVCPISCVRVAEAKNLPQAYIAAQAPVQKTAILFWQMIWDNDVKLIIMLTRSFENSKEKCYPYWPVAKQSESEGDISEKTIGHFCIRLQSQENEISYTRRILVIINQDDNKIAPRRIVQLHMTAWTDFSAPRKDDLYAFLSEYWETRKKLEDNGSPILVHCSAGVGRTGTFIALDQLCQHVRVLHELGQTNGKSDLEDIYENLRGSQDRNAVKLNKMFANPAETIKIYETVLWLRSQRRFMVQNESQYIFLFDFIADYIARLSGEENAYDNI
uniref:Protein-tyrosine-phosphatase n=1 Tax=Schistocephalus solidus TaxID=70667 RepID=A0A0X3NN65_SCHSO